MARGTGHEGIAFRLCRCEAGVIIKQNETAPAVTGWRNDEMMKAMRVRDVVTENVKIDDFASFMEAYNSFGAYQSADGNAVVFLFEDYDDFQALWPDFVVSHMAQNKTNLTVSAPASNWSLRKEDK